MAETWYSQEQEPPTPQLGLRDWVRVARRGLPLAVLVFGCLLILLAVRVIEAPFHGQQRPWTPRITQFVCRNAFRILGLSFATEGTVMQGPGAVVANHVSWLDIFALNATKRIYFVAKAEVAGWPGIGWLARATGTVFIKRDRSDAVNQLKIFQQRLKAGHKLLFFPEGTSTDGLQVLPFKPTLFAAFFHDDLRWDMRIQPVTMKYISPVGEDPRFYGWWGTMDFGPHLLTTLAAKRQGGVRVRYHPPVNVSDYTDRKSLCRALEQSVRAGLSDDR